MGKVASKIKQSQIRPESFDEAVPHHNTGVKRKVLIRRLQSSQGIRDRRFIGIYNFISGFWGIGLLTVVFAFILHRNKGKEFQEVDFSVHTKSLYTRVKETIQQDLIRKP